MLTTLEIPAHILKHAKRRAVEEGRSLKDVVAQTLTTELAETRPDRTAAWQVPVAPAGMGWGGLSDVELQRVVEATRDEILLHRAGLTAPKRRHAQR